MSDKSAIIKEAQKYLARGQIDKAIAEWEKLAKETPDANTYNTIGDLYLKKGDKSLAVDFFHKAARFFRNDGFSLKALAIYKKILNIETSNTSALFALGELSEEKGLTTDAIKYYLASADILSKEGKKDALLQAYDRILNLSPANIPLRNKVAELFIKEGLQIEAAKEYLHIGRLYDDKDDFNNARGYFKKTLELQPNNREAMLGLSSIYEKTGDINQSLEYIRKALAIFPDDVELSLKCAQLLIKQESFADAMPYASKVVELEPSNIIAKKLLGEIYMKEGEEQKAWEEYNKVIDEMVFEEKIDEAIDILSMFKDIEPVETRKKLVSLYKQKGDYETIFTELIFLGDTFVLSEEGKLKEALNCYREALQIRPDDVELQGKITDLEREMGVEHVATETEKSIEESLAEAEIFVRYGLYDEARALLERLRMQKKENVDVHVMLKSLYADIGDKEQAVGECLILSELYNRAGNTEKRERVLKEAHEINPDDPRLVEGAAMQFTAEFISPVSEELVQGLNVEDYSEDLAEAEFYMRQGLNDDARAIYERLQGIFPDNEEIKQKLSSLGTGEGVEHVFEEETTEKVEKPVEEFVVHEELEAQEVSEPALESDVLDIFEEFKKGLEKELETGDSETHYNLGIAYKEMGLIDDAIREFQISKNDTSKFIQSVNMLGMCYMSKGLFPLAIDSFNVALSGITTKDESYWGVKYELAEAYEKNENLIEALGLYTEVYGWNARFRNVAEKINLLKVMVTKPAEKPVIAEKQKIRKERVSYL